MKTKNQTVKTLRRKAMTSVGRSVSLKTTTKTFNFYFVLVSNQEEVVSKEQCATLAALVVSDWRKLAVELGLQDFEIECLEKECKTDKAGVGEATNMLRMWRVRVVTSPTEKIGCFVHFCLVL